jgi:peptidoglycan-N-acetylglucosamine deacetylase
MKLRFDPRVHLPAWITGFFPEAIWTMPNNERKVYLTFDDGPMPGVTPYVLDVLREKGIKATFFCVGENVFHYPELFDQIIEEGHAVGNHTYHHIQGIKCSDPSYFYDVAKADILIGSDLFRPPHGLMSKTQYRYLSRLYHLILWDVISCDYDYKLSPEQCFRNVTDFVREGSIITFHDSIKAKKNVLASLPLVIDYLQAQGYKFGRIELPAKNPIKGSSWSKHWRRFLDVIQQKRKSA